MDSFSDGLNRDAPPAVIDDFLPRRTPGHILEHIGHKHTSAAERELPVANLRVGHNELPKLSNCPIHIVPSVPIPECPSLAASFRPCSS